MVIRKITVLIVIAFLFLVSCQVTGEETIKDAEVSVPRNESSKNETIENELTEAKLTEAKTVEKISDETTNWMELYFTAMESRRDETTHIRLIDIDFDSIPEMFLSKLGASNTTIYHGYSIKDGKIVDIEITGEFMPPDLELYENKETGEKIWLAYGEFRSGPSYEYRWNKVDFKEFSNVTQSLFWGWREHLEGEGPVRRFTYQLLEEKTVSLSVTKEQIEQSKKVAFSDFEQVDTLYLFSFVNAFLKTNKAEAELDKSLFYSFAQLYETTCSGTNEDDRLQLPINSILNFNLSGEYEQISRPPLSIVRKDYKRLDEEKQTNIFVGYVQINQYKDQEIRSELNRRLEEEAFGEWDVERETGIELSISQVPYFYHNYLSVKTFTSCYFIDATHPWSSLSAITFDIETGQELKLTDIINIDDSLKNKIFEGTFENEKFNHEQCIEYGIYQNLWDALQYESSYFDPIFYLTESGSLGLILGVPHSMGDYLTFEADLGDLEKNCLNIF